jgi:transcription elongation GreA/GreB family factor
MSVAFRREGDDEHLEPKFELPLPPGPNLVTVRGLALIEARVAELEAALPSITEEASVTAARRELRYWRTRRATAQLMDLPDCSSVSFGCRVSIVMNGQRRTITIVGDDEASPKSGLLAFSAPLCRAIMDAVVGERVAFAGKADSIEIVAIDLPEGPGLIAG